jgi:hypothetical protein
MTSLQTSWIYRSLAWVTPRQAGLVFCGSALVTIIFAFILTIDSNPKYHFFILFMVMFLLTLLTGIFGVVSWLDDRYVKDEENRIAARYGLHFGVFVFLFMMVLTILGFLH